MSDTAKVLSPEEQALRKKLLDATLGEVSAERLTYLQVIGVLRLVESSLFNAFWGATDDE